MRYRKIINRIILTVCCPMLVFFVLSCHGDKPKPIKIGETIPSFTSQALDGKTISLADLKNQPVILRFFLVDCNFCRADTPEFNNFFNKNKEKGLQVVYINNNASSLEAVRTFAENLKIPFPVIFDPKGKIAATYNVKLQPLTMVLDPDHRLLAALLGGVSEIELQNLLKTYL